MEKNTQKEISKYEIQHSNFRKIKFNNKMINRTTTKGTTETNTAPNTLKTAYS